MRLRFVLPINPAPETSHVDGPSGCRLMTDTSDYHSPWGGVYTYVSPAWQPPLHSRSVRVETLVACASLCRLQYIGTLQRERESCILLVR